MSAISFLCPSGDMWLLSFTQTEPMNGCLHTYLHRAEAFVSNEDRPHGTTAHTCCTVASSGTNYKDKHRDELHRGVIKESIFKKSCAENCLSRICVLYIILLYSLSRTTAIAVALLHVCNVALVPDQFVQSIWEG